MFNTANNNIITILGIDKLPAEHQKEAMEKLGSIVYQETMLRALGMMTNTDRSEFEKLSETEPEPEILFNFLSGKIPTINAIIAEESEKLRPESVEIISDIGK
jgi:hypothetical protein